MGPSKTIQAFTLVELMVVLVILGILTGLVVGALRGAQQDTLASKTRATIAKIDAVLNERFY
jgi:prepilin-type N-terminal cleavage/methylation domain-containing protein